MSEFNVVLNTPSGKLRGSVLRSCLGQDYYAFKGIPYAKPPIGSLRFCDPEPNEPWKGVRNALEHGSISLQYDMAEKVVKGSENCLYANVYAKTLESDRLYPVIVNIHGGGFIYKHGNEDIFGPDYLFAKDVVLVTFNYRLGIMGFLNLEDEVAPGNQGLKDQVMLLRWVKTHISHFGGDPDNVTIAGCSSGGTAVHYLTISPLAKGLFHKAICQGGSTALNIVSVAHESGQTVRKLLDHLECKESNPEDIVEFLRRIDGEKLIEAQEKITPEMGDLRILLPFQPGKDDKSANPFMPVHPWIAAEQGVRVPLILGHNDGEGVVLLSFLDRLDFQDVNCNLIKYIHPSLADLMKHYNCTFKDLRKMYFGDGHISDCSIRQLVNFLGDIYFIESTHRVAKIQARSKATPTYFYKFCFNRNVGLKKRTIKSRFINEFKSSNCHGDEQTYIFKSKIKNSLTNVQLQEDTGAEMMMKRMIEMWVNFAETGNPISKRSELLPTLWQPLTDDETTIRYLNIDEELKMETMLNIEQRYAFKREKELTNSNVRT